MLLGFATFGTVAEERAALVVGVGHYAVLRLLLNAIGDVRAVAGALGQAGFKVTLLVDPSIADLRAAAAAAAADVQTAAKGISAALFYYAGHAVQFQNRNYLLAANADPRDADALDDQGLELTEIAMRMVEAALLLVILDSCRDSPLDPYSSDCA